MGSSSHASLGKKTETFQALKANQVPNAEAICQALPMYWGTQPFTSGPVYVGAIVFFLFVLGLFVVKGSLRWWLLTATILSLLLAWGKNFMFLTDLFLDYFPGYNKFRSVAMILVIAEFAMPLLGIIVVKNIVEENIDLKKFMKYFKIVLGSIIGLLLIFAIMPGMFYDFNAASDAELSSKGWPDFLLDALRIDRKSMFTSDAFRSLIFILLFAVALLALIYKKISKSVFYAIFAILIIADMWPVNKRYLNSDSFVSKSDEAQPFKPTQANNFILKDKDPNFRVLNVAVNTFNDASTSYFHNSIGGYHGAKMKRYQELIEYHISKNNMSVLNMLNTKYFIVPTKDRGPMPQQNYGALGHAWFVNHYRLVQNADSEIMALNKFDPKTEAIVDKRFEAEVKTLSIVEDSLATIELLSYKPNHLTYKSKAKTDQLAIFSEIYYNNGKGWEAYVDGKPVPHFRANYVLRAMKVPAGEHTIEYKFEPKSYYTGEKISLASSVLLIILFVGLIVRELFFINKSEKIVEQKKD
jgi:hypothetical protein